MLSLVCFLRNALFSKALMTTICMMGFYSNRTSFAFPSRPFGSYFCRNHMEVASWDTLVVTRPMPCLAHITFGRACKEMSNAYAPAARHVYKLSQNPTLMACIFHYLSLFHLGPT